MIDIAPPAFVQLSSFMSSGACGGVLIAIALIAVLPSGLVPPCAVPFGMMTRSPGLTFTSLSPSQIVPVPSRMYCISLAFGCMCLGTLPAWTDSVMPSCMTSDLERRPVPEAMPSASPDRSGTWMICGVMSVAARACGSTWVAAAPATKASATDETNAMRFMEVLPDICLTEQSTVGRCGADTQGRTFAYFNRRHHERISRLPRCGRRRRRADHRAGAAGRARCADRRARGRGACAMGWHGAVANPRRRCLARGLQGLRHQADALSLVGRAAGQERARRPFARARQRIRRSLQCGVAGAYLAARCGRP